MTETSIRPAALADAPAFYVATDHEGEGQGRRRLERTAAELARMDRPVVQLGLLAANGRAWGFYEHLGGRVEVALTRAECGSAIINGA